MIRITVVHQGALGDTVLLIPLLRSLRERFNPCTITLVSKVNLGQMLTMLGFVDGYASADDREHAAWFVAPEGENANSCPAWATAEVLISAVSNGTDAWAANARAARRGAGNSGQDARTTMGGDGVFFFEPRPAAGYAAHVTDWHREQLGALGLGPAPLPLLRANPDGAIVIHPGSGGDAKCWPRERFISLGRTLKRNGIVPTFVLGEVEQDKWGRTLIEELKGEFPWYLHMGLYEMAERIGRARMFLGNDSGVSHVAGAMGVPTIVLFGPSNDAQWRPVGAAVKVLRAAAPNERSMEALGEEVVLGEVMAELRKIAM